MKTAARRVGISVEEYRIKVASGLKWCTRCKQWQPVAEFARDSSRGDGRTAACDQRYIRGTDGPTQKERRARLAAGQRWCSGCKEWLSADAVSQGKCREHRNAAAREWYATGSPGALRRRGRSLARKRGLERIPDWWAEETREQFGGECAYGCGRPGTTWDHIWPVSRGGISTPGNLVPACTPCNSSKKDTDPTPWVERGLIAFPWHWTDLMDLAMQMNTDDWCSWDEVPWGPLAGEPLAVAR